MSKLIDQDYTYRFEKPFVTAYETVRNVLSAYVTEMGDIQLVFLLTRKDEVVDILMTFFFFNLGAVVQSLSHVRLCDPMDCSTSSFPVHHQLPELAQTRVHRVSDAIQPSHPLSSPSPPAFNLSQHQGLFQRVSSSHQVAKILELQLQHQSFN